MKNGIRLTHLLLALGGLTVASTAYGQNRLRIILPAASYVASENVAAGTRACGNGVYGAGVILNIPPCRSVTNAVVYDIVTNTGGLYVLAAEYAAVESRPVTIVINGAVEMTNALRSTTGCWEETCQRWFVQDNIVELRPGTNRMRVERDSYFPHIRAFSFKLIE